jgi:RimJ/RimL family protein N-acetyltransferase
MIRPYTPKDYEKVLAFIREFGDRHVLGLPERKSDVRVGFIDEGIGLPDRRPILGYSAMSFDGKYSITVVRKDCRGQGIASNLLKAKIQWAREVLRLPYLETKVGVTNHASIGMLNKLGYQVVGLGTSVTNKPVLTMRLTL